MFLLLGTPHLPKVKSLPLFLPPVVGSVPTPVTFTYQPVMSTPAGTHTSTYWFVFESVPPVSDFMPSFQLTSLIHARPGETVSMSA